MRYIFVTVFICFIMGCGKAADSPSGKPGATENLDRLGIVIAQSGLNMRSFPIANAVILTTIPFLGRLQILTQNGEFVEVAGYTGKWTQVQSENQTGWVLSAREFMATTNPLDRVLFVAKESGADFLLSPGAGAVIGHLEYGSPVRLVTDSFLIDGKRWYVAEVDSKQGYLQPYDLTTVTYPLDKFKNGPFVGMKYFGLPSACAWGGRWMHIKASKDLILNTLKCNGKGGFVLEKESDHFGGHVDHEILQVITPQPEKGQLTVLGGWGLSDIMCSNLDGPLPLAIVDLKRGIPKKGADMMTTYSGVVVKFWRLDTSSGILVEAIDEKAGCVLPPASMFD